LDNVLANIKPDELNLPEKIEKVESVQVGSNENKHVKQIFDHVSKNNKELIIIENIENKTEYKWTEKEVEEWLKKTSSPRRLAEKNHRCDSPAQG
jgi:hypothetical protein